MKKNVFYCFAVLFFANKALFAQIINFPDTNFKKALLENQSVRIDVDNDGEISKQEALKVTSIQTKHGIEFINTKGIEEFKNLRDLDLSSGEQIDVSKNTKLTNLDISSDKLLSIDVRKNTKLIKLDIFANNLSSIDVRENTRLRHLELRTNVSSIDISKNTGLTSFHLWSSNLSSIDVRGNTGLIDLSISSQKISSIDVRKNKKLIKLSVYANNLSSLDISENIELKSFDIKSKEVSSLDFSKNLKISNLQIQHCPKLTDITVNEPNLIEYFMFFGKVNFNHNTFLLN